MSLKHIIEGFRNHLIPPAELKEKIQEVSDKRMAICNPCDFNSDNAKRAGKKIKYPWRPDTHCILCDCNLIAKSKALSDACPIKKWLAETDEATAEELKKQLSDDD